MGEKMSVCTVQSFIDAVSSADADNLLVHEITRDMNEKLAKKRKDGYSGWHTSDCSNSDLVIMLKAHIDKGDMIDVINIAAMIHCRTKLYGPNA